MLHIPSEDYFSSRPETAVARGGGDAGHGANFDRHPRWKTGRQASSVRGNSNETKTFQTRRAQIAHAKDLGQNPGFFSAGSRNRRTRQGVTGGLSRYKFSAEADLARAGERGGSRARQSGGSGIGFVAGRAREQDSNHGRTSQRRLFLVSLPTALPRARPIVGHR